MSGSSWPPPSHVRAGRWSALQDALGWGTGQRLVTDWHMQQVLQVGGVLDKAAGCWGHLEASASCFAPVPEHFPGSAAPGGRGPRCFCIRHPLGSGWGWGHNGFQTPPRSWRLACLLEGHHWAAEDRAGTVGGEDLNFWSLCCTARPPTPASHGPGL